MIQITVPIDPKLHAHATHGAKWTKTIATKEMRYMARLLSSSQPPIEGEAVLYIVFRVPNLRRRDTLNMCQSLKPAIDGVVDAGRIEGDHWDVLRIGKIEVVVVKELKSVEAVLTFKPIECCSEFFRHDTGVTNGQK